MTTFEICPGLIRNFQIITMPFHALLEKTVDVSVVRVLREAKTSTVIHKLFEFFWLVLAKLLDRSLFLFLFDVCILLSFGSAW